LFLDALEQAKSLVDQAYEVILDAVCDGTFKPGERLTQEDIATRLKVSRQPVTHALAMLKAQGFLIETGRRGLAVAPVDPRLFEEIYQLRSAVEPLAVRLAIPRFSADALRQGRAIVARGRSMVLAEDARAVLEADMAFHSFIYELSGNSLIADTMHMNWRHLRRAMGEVLRFPGMSISVWKEHAQILEAMGDGDGERAAELMRRHLVEAFERVGKQTQLCTT
jgi:DNA-binding GntR family transcriptional regulator